MRVLTAVVASTALGLPCLHREPPMTKAAVAFVAGLTDEQRKKAVLPTDSPDRSTWGYVPGQRLGLAWNEMTAPQRAAAVELLRVSLSEKGYQTVEAIRGFENVLRETENNPGRDPEKYWFVFYGTPSAETPWLWRYEGHHVSLTFTLKGSDLVASTPQFLGSNPAEVRSGPHTGESPLRELKELGFKLVESLNVDQRVTAVLSETAPNDIVTSNTRKASIEGHLGVPYTALDDGQKKTLRALIKLYADVQSKEEEARRLARIQREGYDSVVFAWIGSLKHDGKHYYRIQGKTFVIEYDNTQNDANHIHSVWRDMDEDFGEDALADHYAHDHQQ